MSDMLLSIVAGALAGIAACVLLLRYNLVPAARSTGIADAATQKPPPATEPSAPLLPIASPEATQSPETLATALATIGKTLSPLAEEISHPGLLPDMPEFQAAVTAFRRPEATLELLRQYAFGDNWPLACAAFIVLAERPERQPLGDAVLRHLPNARPYAILYALRFLATLEHRPPVGAAFVATLPWWQNNAVIPSFFQDFLVRRAELGDRAEFGDSLDKQTELDSAPIVGLLQRIQHPFAAQLLTALRIWLDTRIDKDFLRTVGVLWEAAEQDPLLIAPDGWQEGLAAAEAAMHRSQPRSVLVCGDPRVGKTAFIKLLCSRFQQQGWTVFAASGTELMADQIYIGQLEGRIRKVVEAVQARRKVLWYVPDLAQIASSGTHEGQSASILDQVFPDVAAGKLIIIGEASQAAATRLFQKRPSMRSLIEVVALQPMDDEQTASLAAQVGQCITGHVKLEIPAPTIVAAMDLARHFLGSGQQPGAALELLKRAADRSITAGETLLTPESVVATLSQISGLPAIVLDTHQRVELANVHEFFRQRVMGQDEAIKAVVDRVAMLKAGLTDPGRPIGVFLFAGPTGTGKTELAKNLAEFLFGSADRMIRLDMSEFQTIESTSKILGDQRDAAAESLISRIHRQPFSVVLLDEFEKAHPNCWDLFLQIFDDGRLSDARGNEADFRHCIIILTSNLGATAHKGSGLGFRPNADSFVADQVMRSVNQTFRPEFVNRLDKIIVFQPLSRELMRGILHKELACIQERRGLRDRAWAMEWEASAIEFLLDKGFSPEMGARPLKRAIDQLLLAPLAATMVEHRFPQGDQFLFVRSNGKEIEVEFVDPDAEPPQRVPHGEETDDRTSLPSIILSPTGSEAEQASLVACWRQANEVLSSDAWRRKEEQLQLAFADPTIWSRTDRHIVFAGIELAGRIGEAARSTERLLQRYKATSAHGNRTSRELAGRLALQLHNLRQGTDDFLTDVPVDALLRIEPAFDMGGEDADLSEWCRRLADMYRKWAEKRRMKVEELFSDDRKASPILLVTGFGAFRTLTVESGLHVLEDEPRSENVRRVAARVTAIGGGDRDFSASGAHAVAHDLLAVAPITTTNIVRRYREQPAPLVRDVIKGWRSGKLAAVLGGDFDLIGEIKREQAGS
ncbi:MAG: AAA family ATPase [Proteobacteria bacterium]|nr:AAA family ATPase [Pseudomonadota bacterium]